MNWQHLIYFEKVADYGMITKAAEELFLTPSTLSRAISSLEDEIGVVLFERQGRTIMLNRYGRCFYEYVKRATREVNNGFHVVQRMANILTGSVRVSSIFSVGSNFMPKLLAAFFENTENKEIRIELSQRTTAQILADIENNELDIAFCGEFDNQIKYSCINREPVYDEKIMLVVPEKHTLANRKSVSFEEIKDEIFIGYNNSTGIVTSIYDAIARRGYPAYRFKTVLETNEDNNATNLVKEGFGIAFVVDNPSIYTGGVKVLELSDLNFFRTIYMVWKKDSYLSPAANRFREMVFLYKTKL